MKYPPINSRLFTENRQRFCREMKPGSIAIFHSNDEMPRSADQSFDFRQNPDLFYLSGIDQEDTILILFPDAPNPKYREILFIKETSDHIRIWEGYKLTQEEARKSSGIEQVHWNDDFDNIFPMLMHLAENVYLNLNEHDRSRVKVPYREWRFALECQKEFPLHHYERAAPILHRLRSVKSDIEIELIRTACQITEGAFRRVLKFIRPDVMEYEIEAEIIHEFIRHRATGHAYSPIVASGENACILHYTSNNQLCRDGELILMDFGAEYANYNADLSRTVPVNGRFTPRQRAVYDAVLSVFKQARQLLRPGSHLEEYHREVGKLMEEELIALGLLSKEEVKKQNPDMPLYKRYFMHGTSHYLGLDVHDVGSRHTPFINGMVFTCEPGIYIPEEKIGIRLENDILITTDGPVDLMEDIPIEAEEIEELMHKKK